MCDIYLYHLINYFSFERCDKIKFAYCTRAAFRQFSTFSWRVAHRSITAVTTSLLQFTTTVPQSHHRASSYSSESPSDDALPKQLVENLLALVVPSRDRKDDDAADDDADDDDDALSSSPAGRAVLKITVKILKHLMEARWVRRRVVVAHDPRAFARVARRLATRFGARRDPDVDLAFVARLIDHSIEDAASASAADVQRLVGVVEEAQAKALALEDKDSWNVFNECRKKMLAMGAA